VKPCALNEWMGLMDLVAWPELDGISLVFIDSWQRK
jgi:hypothetical protein